MNKNKRIFFSIFFYYFFVFTSLWKPFPQAWIRWQFLLLANLNWSFGPWRIVHIKIHTHRWRNRAWWTHRYHHRRRTNNPEIWVLNYPRVKWCPKNRSHLGVATWVLKTLGVATWVLKTFGVANRVLKTLGVATWVLKPLGIANRVLKTLGDSTWNKLRSLCVHFPGLSV